MVERVGGFNVPGIPRLIDAPARSVAPVVEWQARVSREAPRVPWDVFTRRHFTWKQGEHVGLIGPTGQGKTTLLTHLLPLQPYVVVFATKPYDESMDRLVSTGYERMERWQSISPQRVPRRVLWPSALNLDSEDTQRAVFKDALAKIYRERGWCVVIDEGWYFTNVLNLSKEIKTYLLQARSLSISLVFATQRPAWVPLEVFDQSTHLFFYRDNDERNLSRLSGISYRSADLIKYIVSNLEQYQALYINTRTGEMCRTRVPGPVPMSTGRGEVSP
jgi:energy-coupling factor transporter ATP-binding protein EcfA2